MSNKMLKFMVSRLQLMFAFQQKFLLSMITQPRYKTKFIWQQFVVFYIKWIISWQVSILDKFLDNSVFTQLG